MEITDVPQTNEQAIEYCKEFRIKVEFGEESVKTTDGHFVTSAGKTFLSSTQRLAEAFRDLCKKGEILKDWFYKTSEIVKKKSEIEKKSEEAPKRPRREQSNKPFTRHVSRRR